MKEKKKYPACKGTILIRIRIIQNDIENYITKSPREYGAEFGCSKRQANRYIKLATEDLQKLFAKDKNTLKNKAIMRLEKLCKKYKSEGKDKLLNDTLVELHSIQGLYEQDKDDTGSVPISIVFKLKEKKPDVPVS